MECLHFLKEKNRKYFTFFNEIPFTNWMTLLFWIQIICDNRNPWNHSIVYK